MFRLAGSLLDASESALGSSQYCRSDLSSPWLRDVIADHRDVFTSVTLTAGERLFEQEEAPDALYVVQEDHLDIYMGTPETTEAVARFGEGDVVGEMGLVGGQARTATVVAVGPICRARVVGQTRRIF